VQSYFFFTGDAFVVEIFADAAGRVSAHEGFRTVGVEYPHREAGIAGSASAYQHKPVASDAGVRPAPCLCRSLWVADAVYRRVHVYIIVARSVHLRKSDSMCHAVNFLTLNTVLLFVHAAKLRRLAIKRA
jgi:hypothetical protein